MVHRVQKQRNMKQKVWERERKRECVHACAHVLPDLFAHNLPLTLASLLSIAVGLAAASCFLGFPVNWLPDKIIQWRHWGETEG